MPAHTSIPQLPFSWTPRNKMIICSLATGPKHIPLLKVMAPTVSYYALTHKMDSLVLPLHSRLDASRPPAWDKIIMIRHALTLYDTVIWIDADAIICDPTRDIRKALDPNYSMHLVPHPFKEKDRTVVNTGVWVCRKDPIVFKLLDEVWNHTEFIDHKWWEQAALMDLLGFDVRTLMPNGVPVCTFRGPTPYSHLVQYLNEEWNCIPYRPVNNPVIKHYIMEHNKKVDIMKKSYDAVLQRIWNK